MMMNESSEVIKDRNIWAVYALYWWATYGMCTKPCFSVQARSQSNRSGGGWGTSMQEDRHPAGGSRGRGCVSPPLREIESLRSSWGSDADWCNLFHLLPLHFAVFYLFLEFQIFRNLKQEKGFFGGGAHAPSDYVPVCIPKFTLPNDTGHTIYYSGP